MAESLIRKQIAAWTQEKKSLIAKLSKVKTDREKKSLRDQIHALDEKLVSKKAGARQERGTRKFEDYASAAKAHMDKKLGEKSQSEHDASKANLGVAATAFAQQKKRDKERAR